MFILELNNTNIIVQLEKNDIEWMEQVFDNDFKSVVEEMEKLG